MKLSKIKIKRLENYLEMYNHVYNSDNNFHKITGEMLYHNETGTKFLNEINKKKHYTNFDKWMLNGMEKQYQIYIKYKKNK